MMLSLSMFMPSYLAILIESHNFSSVRSDDGTMITHMKYVNTYFIVWYRNAINSNYTFYHDFKSAIA